jgi:hypothetical protein
MSAIGNIHKWPVMAENSKEEFLPPALYFGKQNKNPPPGRIGREGDVFRLCRLHAATGQFPSDAAFGRRFYFPR